MIAVITCVGMASTPRAVSAQELLQNLPRARPGHWGGGVVLGDLTGDSHPDLLEWGKYFKYVIIMAGDGNGRYRLEPQQNLPLAPLPSLFPLSRCLCADFDRDGDRDIFLIVGDDGLFPGWQDRLWINNGSGVFSDETAQRLPVDAHQGYGAIAADFDGDADIDVITGSGARNGWKYYVNDGSGRFSDQAALRIPNAAEFVYDLAAGDMDGDGDLDLVAGTFGDPQGVLGGVTGLFLNDGQGTFRDATSWMPSIRTRTRSIALADVDRDGDLDVMLGCLPPNATELHQNRLFINDGTGKLTDESLGRLPGQPQRSWTGAIAFLDVDGDGDLDLFEGGRVDAYPQLPPSRLWENDGRGYFRDVTGTLMPFLPSNAGGVVAADLDGDGDIDVYVASGLQTDLVYWNLRYQVYAPVLPGTGRLYIIESYGPRNGASVPMMGLPGPTVWIPPFGGFRLDPRATIVFPAIPLSASGKGQASVRIPSDPRLIGLEFRVQAFQVDWSSQALHRLTNAWGDKIEN